MTTVVGTPAAGGPAAAALSGAGAQAVILTDGPSGGLAFISEGLRANGLTAAQFLGMQRWDVSAEALAVPALQGGAFAAPDPNLVNAFVGRYQTAYGESPHELAGLAYDGVAAVGAPQRQDCLCKREGAGQRQGEVAEFGDHPPAFGAASPGGELGALPEALLGASVFQVEAGGGAPSSGRHWPERFSASATSGGM